MSVKLTKQEEMKLVVSYMWFIANDIAANEAMKAMEKIRKSQICKRMLKKRVNDCYQSAKRYNNRMIFGADDRRMEIMVMDVLDKAQELLKTDVDKFNYAVQHEYMRRKYKHAELLAPLMASGMMSAIAVEAYNAAVPYHGKLKADRKNFMCLDGLMKDIAKAGEELMPMCRPEGEEMFMLRDIDQIRTGYQILCNRIMDADMINECIHYSCQYDGQVMM